MNVTIGGKTYRAAVPVTISRTLDESLDAASVVIPYTDRREAFVPFTYAELDGERWIVGADQPKHIKGLNKWRHDVTLVEETKRLETMFISAKVITKHDYRDYSEEISPPYSIVNVFDPDQAGISISEDITPGNIGVSTITDPSFTLNPSQAVRNRGVYTDAEKEALLAQKGVLSTRPYAVWIECAGRVLAYTDELTKGLSVGLAQIQPFIGDTLEAHYFFADALESFAGSPMIYYEVVYNITPVLESDRTTNKTVYEVCTELIEDAEQSRYGDDARMTLDPTQAEELKKIEAPEDAFSSGMTLFEALLKIGDWEGVSGIPRLQRDVIKFEKWGGTDVVELGGRVIYEGESATADEYTTVLESNAENMVDESNINAVVDPFVNGWQTPRVEDGEVFIEDNAVKIRTAYPIWKILNLSLGYVGGDIDGEVGDLTANVYEKSEYDLLSDFARAGYPSSKAYALYYTKGSPDIQGLSYIARTTAGDLGFERKSAIEQILRIKYGKDPKLSSKDIISLPFRVTYIPFVAARIRQHRMQTNGIEAAMAYGQGGSVISARTYGGHLRAVANRLGLPQKTVQVIYKRGDTIPAPGQKVDAVNYIGTVDAEYYPDFIKAQLTMSPNYNRINQFIDVKRDLRQYAIPMDGSTDRNIVCDDFIVIGDYEGRHNPMTSQNLEQAVVLDIVGADVDVEVNGVVCATSNDHRKTDGVQVILPLIRVPMGNSVLMYGRYKDNYSAGVVSEYFADAGDSRRIQKDVRYTDVFGNAKYLHLDFVQNAEIRGGSANVDGAHEVPRTDGVDIGKSVITTGSQPIMLNKDARENISFSYQLHYVSNRDIIIGQGLAANAPYLRYNKKSAAQVFLYQSHINSVTGESSETDSPGYTITYGQQAGTWYLSMPEVPAHKAWAIKQDGIFLLGANSELPEKIFFNFRDRLREDGGTDEEDEQIEQVFVNVDMVNATHVNLTDYITKGATYYDAFKPYEGSYLPTSITVMMGGEVLPIGRYSWSSVSGALMIPECTANIYINVHAMPNTYTVTPDMSAHLTYTGAATVLHGATYAAMIVPDDGFIVHLRSMKVIVGGDERIQGSGYTFDADENMLTIPRVNGDVVIKAWAQDNTMKITFAPFASRYNGRLTVNYEGDSYTDFTNGLDLMVEYGDTITCEWYSVRSTLDMFDEEQDRMYQFGQDSYITVRRIQVLGNGVITFEEYEKEGYSLVVNSQNCSWSPTTPMVYKNQKLVLLFVANDGYVLPSDIEVFSDGVQVFSGFRWDNSTGVFTYTDVTAPLVVRVQALKESDLTTYLVNITVQFWDQYENDLLFTEQIVGTYVKGSVIEFSPTLKREWNGEITAFVWQESFDSVTVNSDITQTVRYVEKADEAPTSYDVDITVEYWDQYENDLLFTESITGTYVAGSVISFDATVSKEWNGEMTAFVWQESFDSVTVNSDIALTVRYNEKADEPLPTYTVDITVQFWDQWGNDLIHEETISGTYVAGYVLEFDDKVYADYDGDEETEAYILQSGNGSITVNSNISETVTYHKEES